MERLDARKTNSDTNKVPTYYGIESIGWDLETLLIKIYQVQQIYQSLHQWQDEQQHWRRLVTCRRLQEESGYPYGG